MVLNLLQRQKRAICRRRIGRSYFAHRLAEQTDVPIYAVDVHAHLNLFVHPFRREDEKPIRLMLSWGKNRRGEFMLEQEEWISVPVRSADWAGSRSWTLPITIDFPNARTILFHELSVSTEPRGRVVIESRQPAP